MEISAYWLFLIQKQAMNFQTCSRYCERSAFVMITMCGQHRMSSIAPSFSSFLDSWGTAFHSFFFFPHTTTPSVGCQFKFTPCSPVRHSHLRTPLSIVKRRVQQGGNKRHVWFPVLTTALNPSTQNQFKPIFSWIWALLQFCTKPETNSYIHGRQDAHRKTIP